MDTEDAPYARPNYLATLSLIIGAGVVSGQMLLMFCSVCSALVLAAPTVIGLAAGYLGLKQSREHLGIGREAAIVGLVLNSISLTISLFWMGFTVIVAVFVGLAELS